MTATAATPEAAERQHDRASGPSTETVATVIVGLLVFLIAVRPAIDNDLWFHLRTADWMLDHRRWVGVDPFNHTRPGVARVQTDWLAQLAYYGVWRLAGLAGVALFVAAMAAGALVVMFRTINGSVVTRAGVVIATAMASSIFWSARTQMLTFVGTVLVSALLRRWRLHPDRAFVWWLVPLFAVWVNAHGGVVYGVLIVGGTLAGELVTLVLHRDPLPPAALRRLGAVTAACLAVLVVNPSGWRVYGLPFHQVSSSTQFVQEYQPPSLGDPVAFPFFVLLGVVVALMVWRWRDADPVEVFLVGGGAFFALQFTRSIPFFAVLAAPVVARLLTLVLDERRERPSVGERARRADPALLLTAVVLGVAVVAISAVRLSPARVDERLQAEFPVGATAWLVDERPEGELFNTFDWGGYLMWEAPEYRVSIDGRTDVYDDYLLTYDSTIRAEPGWQDELDRERVSTVLLERGLPLVEALRNEPGWQVAYEDAVAIGFTRNP